MQDIADKRNVFVAVFYEMLYALLLHTCVNYSIAVQSLQKSSFPRNIPTRQGDHYYLVDVAGGCPFSEPHGQRLSTRQHFSVTPT
jgi:hypothetical protein